MDTTVTFHWLIWTHRDPAPSPPSTHPSVHSSIPPSLLHWDTWDFLPQHNVEYCSYLSLRVELRGRQGRRTTSEGANKLCFFFFFFFYVLVSLFISVQPLLRGSQLAHAPGDSSFSFAKMSFTVVAALSPSRPVFKPMNTAEKKTNT